MEKRESTGRRPASNEVTDVGNAAVEDDRNAVGAAAAFTVNPGSSPGDEQSEAVEISDDQEEVKPFVQGLRTQLEQAEQRVEVLGAEAVTLNAGGLADPRRYFHCSVGGEQEADTRNENLN